MFDIWLCRSLRYECDRSISREELTGDQTAQILPMDKMPTGISALTVVLAPPSESFGRNWLEDQIHEWLRSDDVFRPEYLTGMIIVDTEKRPHDEFLEGKKHMQRTWSTEWSEVVAEDPNVPNLSPGPYVSWKGQLCKAFRLYDDPNQAFMVATKPNIGPGSLCLLASL